MAAGNDWSREEVRQVVEDYMHMLAQELSSQSYNKSAHRRSLLKRLSGRSDGSVELKHQNISAVLNKLGSFWIPGYKPRGNYQGLLEEEVVKYLLAHSEIDKYSLSAAEAPAAVPTHLDFADFEEPKPDFQAHEPAVAEAQQAYGDRFEAGFFRDYAAREARNTSLGKAGEELILRYEQERLSRGGHDKLAGKVEHVSQTRGDGLGFDVLSFEPSGEERFIEVKTTTFAKETPFFASASELSFARGHEQQYRLYRLFLFKTTPKCFVMPGALEHHCALDPYSFRCSFR